MIPEFLSELEYYAPKVAKSIIGEYGYDDCDTNFDSDDSFFDSEDAGWMMEALTDALNDVAGRVPFMAFGSFPTDPADFGYYCYLDSFNTRECEEHSILDCWESMEERNPNRAELKDYDYYIKVTDHGNVTLFNRAYQEVWSLA